MNPFLANLYSTGSASTKQINLIQNFINRRGLAEFRAIREKCNVSTPLHRLSSKEAWLLCREIFSQQQPEARS